MSRWLLSHFAADPVWFSVLVVTPVLAVVLWVAGRIPYWWYAHLLRRRRRRG